MADKRMTLQLLYFTTDDSDTVCIAAGKDKEATIFIPSKYKPSSIFYCQKNRRILHPV